MTDKELNDAIAAKIHPKVTPQMVEDAVDRMEYIRVGTLTMCVVTLRNGFRVTGESACVDARNYDMVIGDKIARDNAMSKIWAYEGYALAERIRMAAAAQLEAPAPINVEAVARTCHEVNRAYCAALGDMSHVSWEDSPEWVRESARMGVDLHLMGDFGPEATHAAWTRQKYDAGWTYGPVKDPALKIHPCLVPFEDLPREQQAKDHIFRAVARTMLGK